MKAVFTLEGRKLKIELFGELDHHGAGPLMEKILDRIERDLPRDCVIDMVGLSFMDSSGIAVVLRTYKKMNGLGGRLWVENVPKQPMHVLDAAGIDRVVGITALAQ